ncbi:MAG: pyridoxamine 5-phosphate oxidase [Nitrospinae bacterium]|nr:pyridoxamine 5-phosphate oxidase [Nitrospinota bacterium]
MKLPGSKGEHKLQKKLGTSKKALSFYNRQMLDHLNPAMCEFLARQEMVFIATSDANGECDCSFRNGPPGWVRVIDEKTLAFPEYRGNGVFASMGNIMENPHIGMIFVDFFDSTVGLHVNGKVRIFLDQKISGLFPDAIKNEVPKRGGLKAQCWVIVEIEEAYIHCSKHVPKLKKMNKEIHWGTNLEVHKKSNSFISRKSSRARKKAK